MNDILVSIIMPCYNQAEYMQEALDSVLAQTHINWECIIVNDGSTDDTAKIAIANCAKDTRFKYIEKQNGGLSSARNAGLKAANGNWIQFLDSDDYIMPQKLELSVEEAAKDASLNLVVSDFKMFVNSHVNHTAAFCELQQECLAFESILFNWGEFVIPIHCGLFKKNLFDDVQFNETFTALEDWLMWLEVFKSETHSLFLSAPLAYYRNNPRSMTKDKAAFLNSQIFAYKHILDWLPEKYTKKFSQTVIDNLHKKISHLEADLSTTKNSSFYKLESYLKATLRILRSKN